MSKKLVGRLGLLLVAILIIVFYQKLGVSDYLSLKALKDSHANLTHYYSENPAQVIGIFLIVYIVSTAASLPGATILTLAGGAIFGFWFGTLLVSIASTLGATLAFLVSRFLLRDFVEARFGNRLGAINRGIEREGALYLFTLRLVPLFPFFLVNLTMGMTSIKTLTFLFVSQVGMLPGTAVYVNAGTQLAQLDSLKGILSPPLLLSFVLIGVLPLLSKWSLAWFKQRRVLTKYKKPKRFDYNLVVIGGGSAGLVSAYIAAAVKAKVALIEKHKMGGDCLNTGCVPSKAFIRSAKIMQLVKRAGEFGLKGEAQVEVDFPQVMQRIQNIIKQIEPHDSMDRYEKLGVECLEGEARLKSPYEIQVGERTITAKNICLATGARPLVPPIPGLKDAPFVTSDTVWDLRVQPKKLIVLGGGPIGCELAQSFARLGSEVIIVEMGDRLLSREDQDVSAFVARQFQADNVAVRVGHKALRVDSSAGQFHLICEHRGAEVRFPFDQILLALGRRANVEGFGLEELGVEISKKGTLEVDEYLRTTKFPNLFACGDVTGPYQFTHTASHQAWFVAVNALFRPFKKFKVDYRVIPWCTFIDPEVARVGLNELEAKEQKVDYRVSQYSLEELDRAITESEAHGFVKVLTPKDSDKILGVTIVGDHAGENIAEFVTAMKYNLGLNKILGTIHIYPTWAEANKYAAGVWKKSTAPEGILRWLKRLHEWRL